MFTIDGIEWDYPCDIERVSEITPSEISGALLDRSYFNDVLGQYLSYTIKITVPLDRQEEYNVVYEQLTQPVDGHSFILPYNSGTVAITGRVANVSDIYVRLPGGALYWKGTKFTVIANHPTRMQSLGQTIAIGRSPYPEVANPQEGATYTYRNGSWGEAETYANADDIYY